MRKLVMLLTIIVSVLNVSCTLNPSDEIQAASYQIVKHAVKSQLNYPSTADFSLMSVEREKIGGNTWIYKGDLTAKNAFGVEQELRYRAKLTYLEGNPLDPASWNIISCDVW